MEHIKEMFRKRVNDFENENSATKDGCDNTTVSQHSSINGDGKRTFLSLSESEAGITEYLGRNVGFGAVMKERFSDFQVHEIDLDGNIVCLTNFTLPKEPSPPIEATSLLEDNVWDQLDSLVHKKITSVVIEATQFDKETRRQIHKLIKAKYQKLLSSTSVVNDERRTILVTLNKNTRDTLPTQNGKYLHFVLFKTNMDTMDAINLIASKLCTPVSGFTYAGTKDKRGNTSQWVSLRYLIPERLSSINKSLGNIKVGNFVYKNRQLKLGDLKGNHFKIALRNVTADSEVIDSALNSLKDNGFINYFGLQRFGNCPDVPTFKIGKCLLKGEFQQAVELILKPRGEKTHKDGLQEARKIYWETKDAKMAYNRLRSKNKTYEGKLLLGLCTQGKSAYVNALNYIPKNVRLLYLHSYQSLLWNKIVSKRIKTFGAKVLAGDLIWVRDEINEDNCDIKGSDSNNSACLEPVRCITELEVNNYEIFDIVHPLPGYNSVYPDNIIKTWYEELFKEEGLLCETFRQKVKGYSLSGTYRNIVKKVKDLSWETVFYSKPEEDLIFSDIDIMQKTDTNIISKENGEYKAIIMKFALDSSTYATMAVREVLKVDTSSSYQASLNNYSKKRKSEVQDDSENKKIKV